MHPDRAARRAEDEAQFRQLREQELERAREHAPAPVVPNQTGGTTMYSVEGRTIVSDGKEIATAAEGASQEDLGLLEAAANRADSYERRLAEIEQIASTRNQD